MKPTVFLIRNIAPECYGGGESYQIELAKVLKKKGYRPIIFTASKKLLKNAKDEKIETVKAPYLKMQNWSSWRNLLLPIYYVWQIKLKKWYKGQIKKYNPVLLNVQSRDELIGATLAGVKCKKRVIWTDHADFRTWSLVNVNVKVKNQIGKWILRCGKKVYRIILINDYEREFFEKLVYPRTFSNLEVIKNGVLDEYEKYKNIKPRPRNFCFVGRMVEDKGVKELLLAFPKVLEKYPNSQLNLYGEGEDFEKFKPLVKYKQRIIFHGYVKEPLKVLSENEIFILPSYHEGLSLSLLEAAMMEKKIVASDIAGNKEVIQNKKTGILVPVKKPQSLAEAMIYMLENRSDADKMAKNARNYYKQNFDLERIFDDKMNMLYKVEENE